MWPALVQAQGHARAKAKCAETSGRPLSRHCPRARVPLVTLLETSHRDHVSLLTTTPDDGQWAKFHLHFPRQNTSTALHSAPCRGPANVTSQPQPRNGGFGEVWSLSYRPWPLQGPVTQDRSATGPAGRPGLRSLGGVTEGLGCSRPRSRRGQGLQVSGAQCLQEGRKPVGCSGMGSGGRRGRVEGADDSGHVLGGVAWPGSTTCEHRRGYRVPAHTSVSSP